MDPSAGRRQAFLVGYIHVTLIVPMARGRRVSRPRVKLVITDEKRRRHLFLNHKHYTNDRSYRKRPSRSKMIRQEFQRIDPKRRAILSHKKKQFATPAFKQQDYPHRLNFYETPPTAEITLEQFEQWAIDRLKSMDFL
jgi:hypothetical protein